MNRLTLVAVAALVLGLLAPLAFAQESAVDSHQVIITVDTVYGIWVERPGFADKNVYILADPLGVTRDSSSRLGYFLNTATPTQIEVWSSWVPGPGGPEWWACYLNLSWAGEPPKGHELKLTRVRLGKIWTLYPVIVEMLFKASEDEIGEFDEVLILEYEVTVIDKSVPAGSTATGTVYYRISAIP